MEDPFMQSLKTAVIVLLLVTVGVLSLGLLVMHRRHERSVAMPAISQTPVKPKQLWHCGMHPQVVQDHPGECPICHMALTPFNPGGSADADKPKILYWWDPMLGPTSISDHPGKSAMGMDMVPVYASPAGPTITIDPTLQQNMGVRTAVVSRGVLVRTVRAVGILKTPESGMHDVSLKVAGWVDKLYADTEGMHIAAGEPLFDLYSPDLEVAGQELIAATKTQKSLPASAGENVRRDAQSMVDSARRKLELWGVADQEIDTIAKADRPPVNVTFRSPATGHVEEKMIVQGSAVQPGIRLMRIADHSTLWLEAQVYSQDFAFVKEGQALSASVEGIPGRTFSGTITFIHPHVDRMTRTLMMRMTLANPGLLLKPGMYASADIKTQPAAAAILAPREAVIDTGVRQIVFVATGDGHFQPRIVHTGIMGDDDMVQILDGIAPGETVVTSGQFLMDVESRTIEATRKFSGATNPATMPAEMLHDAPMTQPARQDSPGAGKPATVQQSNAAINRRVGVPAHQFSPASMSVGEYAHPTARSGYSRSLAVTEGAS
jgi:RND family efflux transporter MFP subunit